MKRNLCEVIDKMLAHVPAEEAELRAALSSIRNKAYYSSPEGQTFLWRLAYEEFEDWPEPQKLLPWQRVVVELFTGQPIPDAVH